MKLESYNFTLNHCNGLVVQHLQGIREADSLFICQCFFEVKTSLEAFALWLLNETEVKRMIFNAQLLSR